MGIIVVLYLILIFLIKVINKGDIVVYKDDFRKILAKSRSKVITRKKLFKIVIGKKCYTYLTSFEEIFYYLALEQSVIFKANVEIIERKNYFFSKKI
ncbi:hypothetical protein AAEX28_06660 [Lentisphaerota bacterium WC36G]|nr:hypothetical protein LJT99_09525 [Lentisphaerae bacterium WC36]